MLDLGSGAFANLRRHVDYDRLGAVVISHMHADHFLDLVPLRYALRYGVRRRSAKLPVYLPPDGARMLRTLVDAFADEGGEFLGDVFEVREYQPAQPLRIGTGTITFALTAHYIPAFAMRWECAAGSVVYSADTAPEERVVALARDAELFVCEATLRRGETERGPVRGHSSALEAAQMAAAAGARRLVLTHYGDESAPHDLDEAAREAFSGDIIVADDHRILTLGG